MPKKLTQQEFINKANIKHNNYYGYSLVNYINATTKVKIICPKHGEYEQQPNNHLFGQRCIKCMSDNVRNARKFDINTWISKFKNTHGERYNYSLVKPFIGNGMQNKVIIICPKHGEFLMRPQLHAKGVNCPLCNISKGEDEIEKFLIKNNIEYIREKIFDNCINSETNKKLPFDFYLPKINTIIEYHGEQHYKKMGPYFENRAGGLKGRQKRDKIKENFGKNNNINYIIISYKEFNQIETILKNKLCELD